MTATGHALTGVALAVLIPHPIIGIPIGILSHIACDAFPHWDTGTNMRTNPHYKFIIGSFIDLGISLTLPFFLLTMLYPHTNLFYGYVMVIAAQGLDWASAPMVFLHWHFPPFSWVYKFQGMFDNRLDKPWGIIWQIAAVCALLLIAKLLH